VTTEGLARETGNIDTPDGLLSVGVDRGGVAIYFGGWCSADGVRLGKEQRERFQRLFMEAERQAEAMDAEVPY
jgi:hypothetical protein